MGRPITTAELGNAITPDELRRFWSRVDRSGGGTACWPWMGALSSWGYGFARIEGRQINASRASYIIANGPIGADLYVLHHCDNRACVNPRHLYAGTPQQNVRDMDQRGRRGRGFHPRRRGEQHQAARLSDETIAAIRAEMAAGGKQRHVAAKYGCSHTYVGMLVRGEKRV